MSTIKIVYLANDLHIYAIDDNKVVTEKYVLPKSTVEFLASAGFDPSPENLFLMAKYQMQGHETKKICDIDI